MSSIVILSIALAISLIFNGIMYWYSRQLTTKLVFIYDNIGDMSELIANYRVHLKSVYSMEMFYGDETLKYLLDHTRSIGELLEDFEDPEFFLEQFTEEDVTIQQEENIDAETPKINEENVFYAGSRRRDS
tara:strand:- start:837 stop:1229 length:393 start_codon:yes stop_codon:yes gene_type:complete